MSRLVSCLACARHFRVTETACPFCDAPAADSIAGAVPRPRLEGRPLTRAAILFATATTTAVGGLAACGKTTAEPDAAATEPTYRGPAPPYGVPATDTLEPPPPPPPPVDAGPDAAKKKIPVAVPPYGVPATDRKNNPF